MTITFQDDSRELFLLYPDEKKRTYRNIKILHRGIYDIGINSLKIHGFLGLFTYTFRNLESHRLIVYPKIYKLKKSNLTYKPQGIIETVHQYNNSQQNIFSDLRDYQSGDSLNSIHWKLSAKNEKLINKEYKGDFEHNIKIIIDTRKIDSANALYIEDNIIEGVISLLLDLLKSCNPVEVMWHNTKIERSAGDSFNDFNRIYKTLTGARFQTDSQDFLKLIDLSTSQESNNAVVIIFTSVVDFHLYDIILRKKRTGSEIVVVTPKRDEMITTNEYKLKSAGIPLYLSTFSKNDCYMESL